MNCDSPGLLQGSLEVWGPVPIPLLVGAPSKPLLRVSVSWVCVCDLGASCFSKLCFVLFLSESAICKLFESFVALG